MSAEHPTNVPLPDSPDGRPIDAFHTIIYEPDRAVLAEFQAAGKPCDASLPVDAVLRELCIQLTRNITAHFALTNAADGICIQRYILQVKPMKIITCLPRTKTLLGDHLFERPHCIAIHIWTQ